MFEIINQLIKRIATSNDVFYRLYELYSFSCHRSIIQKSKQGNLRLHLGCGTKLLEGWIHLDSSPYLSSEILTAQLPRGLKYFDEMSIQFIYASHILEHIEYPDKTNEFATECYRILQPGGVLRVVVPAIQNIIEAYVRDDRDFFAIQAQIHPKHCTTKLEHLMYALQQDGEHKYGYDFETMRKLLEKAGFTRVTQSDFNLSEFIELCIDYSNTKDNYGNYLSLFVDAIK